MAVTKERRQLLEGQLGLRLNLDDLKWDFRALGAETSEPYQYDFVNDLDEDKEWMLDIKTDSLQVTLYEEGQAMITDTDSNLLFAGDVEWQLLKLVMRLIGVD